MYYAFKPRAAVINLLMLSDSHEVRANHRFVGTSN